jgi:hypothetical protein
VRRDPSLRYARGARAVAAAAVLVARTAGAQPPEPSPSPSPITESELAHEVENPVSKLTSVAVEYQSDFGIGPLGVARDMLSIKPTVALAVTPDLRIMSRTNVPFVSQPDVAHGMQGTSGLGDILESLLLVPAPTAGVIFGLGPTVSLPTATERELGSGRIGLGPIAAVVTQPQPLTLGVLAAQTWSIAGASDRPDINRLALLVIGVFQFAGGWYVRTSPVIVADWNAGSPRNTWTVPVGGGVGKVLRVGHVPIDVFVAAYWNAIRPATATAPSGSAQLQLAVLLPH